MTSDAIATIIAAVLAALVTALVTRLDDIMNLLQTSTRRIDGDWEGSSYLHPTGTDDTWDEATCRPEIKYIANLSQTGKKVNGTLTIIEAPEFVVVRKLRYSGKIVNNYFVYEIKSLNPDEFRLSTAMLNIHTSGKQMDGFFVANGGARDHYRVFVGFTAMKRIHQQSKP
jgi:hypothetical protein